MSVLRQLLGAATSATRAKGGVLKAHPAATSSATLACRSYSSFSGRYFNSAKSRGAVVAAKGNGNSATKAKEAQPAPQDGTDLSATMDGTSADSGVVSSSNPALTSTNSNCITPNSTPTSNCTTNSNPPSSCTTTDTTPLRSTATNTPSSPSAGTTTSNVHLVVEPDFASIQSSSYAHPVITPADLKLHQFFSLHRPLLLINSTPNATNALFNSAPTFESILGPQPQQRQLMSIFDDPLDISGVDADVEAARQLARGLTLNKAGPAVAWEQTLARLGLDPAKEPERVEMQGQMDKDWEDVQILLDSTKRKRRKKMKKHKLKKRRKATRASRLKLK